jgi:outer membrane immunogenic protein
LPCAWLCDAAIDPQNTLPGMRLRSWPRGATGGDTEKDMNTSVATVTIAVVGLTLAVGAHAADLPRIPYAAPTYPTYNWIGPYVGLNFGYQWGSVNNSGAKPGGVMGGVQGGYNWQIGDFVIGAETDLQAADADDMFAAWKFSNPWFGTLRGRVGYAMSNVMLYATFGLAYGGGTVRFAGTTESNTHIGWAGGGGMEVGLTPNWSAKAEYLFVDLSDQRYVLFGNTGFRSNILRLGVNYRF